VNAPRLTVAAKPVANHNAFPMDEDFREF